MSETKRVTDSERKITAETARLMAAVQSDPLTEVRAMEKVSNAATARQATKGRTGRNSRTPSRHGACPSGGKEGATMTELLKPLAAGAFAVLFGVCGFMAGQGNGWSDGFADGCRGCSTDVRTSLVQLLLDQNRALDEETR